MRDRSKISTSPFSSTAFISRFSDFTESRAAAASFEGSSSAPAFAVTSSKRENSLSESFLSLESFAIFESVLSTDCLRRFLSELC